MIRGLMLIAALTLATNLVSGEERTKADSELARLAAGMKPGEWKELATKGYDREFLRDSRDGKPTGPIFTYTNSIHWNPRTQELYFLGAAHICDGKFIAYSAKDNTWRPLEPPEYCRMAGPGGVSHTYENATIDFEHGQFVRQSHGRNQLDRFDIANQKWIEPIRSPGKGGHRSATEYFPEMKTFVRYETTLGFSQRLLRWDLGMSKWTPIPEAGKFEMQRATQPVIEYDPVRKRMLFGGGNDHNELYTLDSKGQVVTIASPPVPTVNSTSRNILTVDPVSGAFLLFTTFGDKEPGPMRFYAHDAERDEWRKLADATPLDSPGSRYRHFKVATPIVDHGVILFCTAQPEKVWLYKHTSEGTK